MRYVFCLTVLVFFLSFHLSAALTDEETEADFVADTSLHSDFCCDRSHKSESAHDISDQESQRRVARILNTSSPVFTKPPSSGGSSGQR